jgi:transcriptional regulator with XRE-family HTH domain
VEFIIGDRIKELRHKKNWSQYDLADKSGVLRATIHLIENGKVKRISYLNIIAIAKALEVTPEEIYGNIPEDKVPIIESINSLEKLKLDIDEVIKKLRCL